MVDKGNPCLARLAVKRLRLRDFELYTTSHVFKRSKSFLKSITPRVPLNSFPYHDLEPSQNCKFVAGCIAKCTENCISNIFHQTADHSLREQTPLKYPSPSALIQNVPSTGAPKMKQSSVLRRRCGQFRKKLVRNLPYFLRHSPSPAFSSLVLTALLFLLLHSHARRSSFNRLYAGRTHVPHASPPPYPHHQKPGISVIAACRDRHKQLTQSLPTWLANSHVAEIVLVDWGSVPLLRSISSHIRVVRVEGEKTWVLSRAYNLAASLVSYTHILRLDCDTLLKSSFTLPNVTGTFHTGDWRAARDENEAHLNGALYITHRDFVDIGGYDERIQTYGWEDEDLYKRLALHGLKRRLLPIEHMQHIEHDDDLRGGEAALEIEQNSILLQRQTAWKGRNTAGEKACFASAYKVLSASPSYMILKCTHRPPSLRELSVSVDLSFARSEALGRVLHDTYKLPWDMLSHMSTPQRQHLALLMKRRTGVVFVHVQHGLGNRLRALASGIAYAQLTRRAAVVIWTRDKHCDAGYEELFEPSEAFVVVDRVNIEWPFDRAVVYDDAWTQVEAYNYMPGERKDEFVRGVKRHVYWKSAYVMKTTVKAAGWDRENDMLRALRPTKEVGSVVEAARERARGSVGVHIRHLAVSSDIHGIDGDTEYGGFGRKITDYWRSACRPATYVDELEGLKEGDGWEGDVFVATDNERWYSELLSLVEDRNLKVRLWRLGDMNGGRDGKGLRRALADMMVLAESRVVLGSMWSSFSEGVARFGGKVRYAGVDFGAEEVDGWGSEVKEAVERVRRRRRRK